MKNKFLILVEQYPNNEGGIGLSYIHTRNIEYLKNGLDFCVLNFSAKEDYIIDGINVITLETFNKIEKDFDILLLHAANIKHHYRFLKKYGHLFRKYVFFYHGHEVMYTNKDYSKPFSWISRNFLKIKMINIYDFYKMKVWHNFLLKNNEKCFYIFVSQWMKNIFLKNIKIDEKLIKDRMDIIYNGIGQTFELNQYDEKSPKKYDFISIRAVLDNSKYGVDIINKLALNTPNAKFLLVGKGDIFKHIDKAKNIEWINSMLNHEEIIKYLNMAKFALMPTRTDAQGLMMCEMTAFGIPVITSNIDVCLEVFDGFNNVYFIDNEKEKDLSKFESIESVSVKDTRFYKSNTSGKEIRLINKLLDD